jgi:predicted ribosome quality control (RQC) complex YloA/Tae2 family protein
MDYHVLTQIIEELSVRLPGARLERVFQGEDRDIYFLLKKDRKNLILLISPQRLLPRLHLVSRKPKSVSNPHPFVLNLRSRLVGTCLTYVGLLNQDRIVEVILERGSDKFHLIIELTGFSSNLLFADENLNIIAMYYPVSPSAQRGNRMLLPGIRYVTPQKNLHENYHRHVQDFPVSGSANVSAEHYYAHVIERRKSEAMRLKMRSLIQKATKKAERKLSALIRDLEAIGEPEEYRHKGGLILAHLQNLRLGIENVILTGYDGIDVHVSMDPQQTPQKNAELYFKKYKKAKTVLPLITDRLGRAEEELAWLRSMQIKVEDADIDSLNLLHSALIVRGFVEKIRGTKRQTYPVALNGIKSIVFQGWEILVGRSADANDRLTTRLARDNDLWFHAEGLPGSHVLIKNSRKMEIPTDVFLKAAALAAFYSKGKESDKVPVTYTEARFIRKPKGAKPGTVMLTQRKTIMIRPAAD